jgi:glycosyltransferase involved in cell wall biosynthesis
MRVAFDVGPVRARPAGVGLYASSVATALADALPTNELTLIGCRPDAVGLPAGIPRASRSLRMPYLGWIEFESARQGRRAGADLVHYADGVAPVVRHGRTVLTVHDLSVVRQWRSHPWRRCGRVPLVLSSPLLADVIVAPSRATADELMRLCGTPSSKIEIVAEAPQGELRPADPATIGEVLSRHGLEPRSYVISVGTIEPRKNHSRLISAFQLLRAQGEVRADLKLVIAGQAGWRYQSVLDQAAADPEHIKMLGYVPSGDLSALIAGSGAAAYVSLYEGFGLPVIEALAYGAPTVTSNLSSMPEVAGDAAFLVDPTDVPAIARGIRDALQAGMQDPQGVAKRATDQASLFSWSRNARETIEIYRRLC